jgi:hypothetical protein
MAHRSLLTAALLSVALASEARALDSWRNVKPGIDYLYRTIGGARPQKIHAVKVDLSRPNIGLHASVDARGREWAVNTHTFAQNTDMTVAVNGDWSCIECGGNDFLRPVGLAIGDGHLWNDHVSNPAVGESWGYLACTIDKKCDAGVANILGHPSMPFSALYDPIRAPLRYFNAVGANAVPALLGGVRGGGCYDGQSAPRTAACIEANRTTLWLFVVDGRNPAGGETGMTCDEVRDQLQSLGCHDAVILDGGGSSTMVIKEGAGNWSVKNTPSEGRLRPVGNHFGVFYSDAIDPRCRKVSGRWCEGTVIKACQGGRFLGEGDCGFFGATCEEDGAFGYCVHPLCPDRKGRDWNVCKDDTHIEGCNDGKPGGGDCAAFGLVCGGARGRAQCMDPRCVVPDGAACQGTRRLECSNGRFVSTRDCAVSGQRCDAATARCVAPPPTPDAGTPDAPEAGGGIDAGSGEGETDGGTEADDGGTSEPDASTPAPGAAPRVVLRDGCLCSGAGSGLASLLLLGLVARGRRRGSLR